MALRLRTKAAYASGDFGLNLYWQGANFFLFYYYTQIIGISALHAGLVLMACSIAEIVADPLIGMLTEGGSRRQRYSRWLLFGSPLLGVSFGVLFTFPTIVPNEAVIAVAFGTNLLFRLAYSAVSVPYAALGTVLTVNAAERSKLSGFRMTGAFLGGIAITGMVALSRRASDDTDALALTALIAAGAGVGCLYITVRAAKPTSRPLTTGKKAGSAPWDLAVIRGNAAFLILIGVIFSFTVGAAFLQQTILLRFEAGTGFGSLAGLAPALMAISALAGIAIVSILADKLGKRRSWLVVSFVMTTAMIGLLAVPTLPFWAAGAFVTVAGASIAGLALLQWSLLPDTVEFGAYRTGVYAPGVIVGTASACVKVSAATAALMAGLIIETAGQGRGGMSIWVGLLPIIAIACSGALMAFYPLTERRHRIIVSVLERQARRAT